MDSTTGITASSEVCHHYYPSSSRFIPIPCLHSNFPDSSFPAQSLRILPLILARLLRLPNSTWSMLFYGYSTSSLACELPKSHLATRNLCSFGNNFCLRLVSCAVNLSDGKITEGFPRYIWILDRRQGEGQEIMKVGARTDCQFRGKRSLQLGPLFLL